MAESSGAVVDPNAPENVTVPPPSIFPEEDHAAIEAALDSVYNGRMEEAQERFKKKMEDGDLSADVHIFKGAVAAHYGRLDEAETEFNKALLINPRNEIAYNDRGNLYFSRNKLNEAIADYTCAMKCGLRSIHWTNRANVYLQQGKFQKSLEDATIATQKYDPEPNNFYIKAEAEVGLGQFDKALEDINQSLKRAKDDLKYLKYRGIIYMKLAEYESALADFNKVIALKPDSASAYAWRARCEAEMHQYDSAIADVRRAETLGNRDPSSAARALLKYADMKYDWEHKPASLPKQWAIACSAQLFKYNDCGLHSLAGMEPSAVNIAEEKRLLSEWWGVSSRETLLSTLSELKAAGHNSLWWMYVRGQVPKMGGKNASRAAIVEKYGPSVGTRGLLAWDLGRYICLCRWGYIVGYLSEDEAYKLMMPAAQQIQKTYSSWQQFGDEYVIGRMFWDSGKAEKAAQEYVPVNRYLHTSKDSPWVYLPWNTKLQ